MTLENAGRAVAVAQASHMAREIAQWLVEQFEPGTADRMLAWLKSEGIEEAK